MEGQYRAPAGLASERNEAAGTLAALKAERASLAAKPTERDRGRAHPLRGRADWRRHRRRACNPMVDRPHGAVLRPARRRADRCGFGAAIHCLKPHLVRSTFDSCRGDAIEGHSA
jgi:hypothetical protein